MLKAINSLKDVAPEDRCDCSKPVTCAVPALGHPGLSLLLCDDCWATEFAVRATGGADSGCQPAGD